MAKFYVESGDIKTVISKSSDFSLPNGKNDKLIYLVKKAKGDIYVSGNSAKNYIDINVFTNNKVAVEWYNYDHLIEYEQLWGKFENFVSVIDLLMNVGPTSKRHINLKFNNQILLKLRCFIILIPLPLFLKLS